jgi:2-phosphoglycerate kinase
MIYIIGGAARSGKSIISRKIAVEHRISYLPLDSLKTAFYIGKPELGIDSKKSYKENARKMWPFIKPFIINLIQIGEDYQIEGDTILPSQVYELLQDKKINKSIRVCFVGYSNIKPEKKLEDIRNNHGNINDWLQDKTDAYVLSVIKDRIKYSRFLKEECEKYNIQYIDMSKDFNKQIDRIIQKLFS